MGDANHNWCCKRSQSLQEEVTRLRAECHKKDERITAWKKSSDEHEKALMAIYEADGEVYLFRNLMALMHGDGGHYFDKHGAKKAYDDAVTKYYELVIAVEDKT